MCCVLRKVALAPNTEFVGVYADEWTPVSLTFLLLGASDGDQDDGD